MLFLQFDYETSRQINQINRQAEQVKHTHKDELEYEWRLVNKTGKQAKAFFEAVLHRLIQQQVVKKETTISKVYQKGSLRKIEYVDKEDKLQNTTYQRKTKPSTRPYDVAFVTDFAEYDKDSKEHKGEYQSITRGITTIRYDVSLEEKMSAQEYANSRERETYHRKRTRYSFTFPSYQIDLSHVIYAQQYDAKSQEEEWQVEMETNTSSTDMTQAFGLLFPHLHSLFTKSAYASLSKLTPNRGIAPVNIMTPHIEKGLLEQFVTNKLDGIAYSLFSTHEGLILKNEKDCIWLTTKGINIPPFAQFRCELFQRNPLQFEIHLYDMSSSFKKQDFDQQFPTFSSRKKFMESSLLELKKCLQTYYKHRESAISFSIFVKTFFPCTNFADGIKNVSELMLRETDDYALIAEQNDGLIFQPEFPSMSNPPLKWKFFDKISVDIKAGSPIEQDGFYLYPCYVYNMDKQENQLFIYNQMQVKLRVKGKKTIDGVQSSQLKDTIVETKYESITSNTIYVSAMRIRFDKTRPNASKVAQDTMFDMLNERTLPMLIKQVEQARSFLKCDFKQVVASMESQPDRKTKLNVYAKEHNSITKCFFPDYNSKTTQRYYMPILLSDVQLKPNDAKTIIRQLFQNFPKDRCSLTIALLGQIEPSSTMLLFAKEISKELSYRRCSSQDTCTLLATQSLSLQSMSENQEIKTIFQHNVQLYNHFYPNITLFPLSSQHALQEVQNPLVLKRFSMLSDTYVEPVKAICFDCMQSAYTSQEVKSLLQQFFMSFSECKLCICILPKDQRGKSIAEKIREMDRASKFVELEDCNMLTCSRSDKVRDANNNIKRELIVANVAGKHVLDIGSGKGGDLAKYREGKASHVTMVEPKYENYRECKERISKHFTLQETKKENDAALFTASDNSIYISTYHAAAQDIAKMHLPYKTYDVISMQMIATFFFDVPENLHSLVSTIDSRLDPMSGMLIGTTVIGTILQAELEKHGQIDTDELTIKLLHSSSNAFGNKIVFDLKESATATSQVEYLVDWQTFVYEFAKVGLYLHKVSKPAFSPTDSFSTKCLLASTVGFVFSRQPLKEMLPIQVQNHFLYKMTTMCQYNALGTIYNSQFSEELKQYTLPYFTGLTSFLDTSIRDTITSPDDPLLYQLATGLQNLCTLSVFYTESFGLYYVKALISILIQKGAMISQALVTLISSETNNLLACVSSNLSYELQEEFSDLVSTCYTDCLSRFLSFGLEDGIEVFQAMLAAVAYCLKMQFAIISNSETILYIGDKSHPLSVLTLFNGQLCVTVAIPQTRKCYVSVESKSMLVTILTASPKEIEVENELLRKDIYLTMKQRMIPYIIHSLQTSLFQYAEAEQLFTYLTLLHLIDAKDEQETWFAVDTSNKEFLIRAMHTYLSYGKHTFGWFAEPLVTTFYEEIKKAKHAVKGLGKDNNYLLAGKIRMNTIALKGIGLAADYAGMGYNANDVRVLETFASSVNRYFNHYCSAFPDVDRDSQGNFFTLPTSAFSQYELLCVNPPYELTFIGRTIERCYELVKANSNLTCMLVLPDWTDSMDLKELKQRSFLVLSFEKGKKTFKDFDQGGKVIEPCNTVFCFIGKERPVSKMGYVSL